MIRKEQEEHVVILERDAKDYILPKDFFHVIVHRFFPVLSMTYIASVILIAISLGNVVQYLFQDRTAYFMAFLVVLWVSVPAVIWVLVRSHPLLGNVADMWYQVLSGLMFLVIVLSFFIFPESEMFGMRIYFALSVPVFLFIYFFLIKDRLPLVASYPLNAAGFCTLVWGINVTYIF